MVQLKSFFLTGFTIGFFATITGILLGIIFSINIETIRNILSNIFKLEIFPADVYFLERLPSGNKLIFYYISVYFFNYYYRNSFVHPCKEYFKNENL